MRLEARRAVFWALLTSTSCAGGNDPACTDIWFADADGDGFGDPWVAETACVAPEDHVAESTDCDDANATIGPGSPETCDGADEDCDGLVDEDAADAVRWYADDDGDGYGADAHEVTGCLQPVGYVAAAGDCNDLDASTHPDAAEVCNGADDDCDELVDWKDEGLTDGTVWFADEDGDGFGDPGTATVTCVPLPGGVLDDTDCDDTNPAVSPVGTETCNSIDDDCDGLTDDEDDPVEGRSSFYADADADGYGDDRSTVDACAAPIGYVDDDQDCDDADAALGAPIHVYDDDDRDGFGAEPGFYSCIHGPFRILVGGDCDDGDAAISPGAEEVCNEVDDNCDAAVDEADPLVVLTSWFRDADGDGYGDPLDTFAACDGASGYLTAGGDCDDALPDVHPGALEECNSVDDDCDGAVDDDVEEYEWYADADGDGFGDPLDRETACAAPSGRVLDATDCDDSAMAVHPGATEICADGVDDDCNDRVDDCFFDLAGAELTVQGEDDDYLGWMVRAADVGADGVADLVLAAPFADSNTSAVYVVNGPTTGVVSSGDATVIVGDSSLVGVWGYHLTTGDLDSDGVSDILASSTSEGAWLFLGPVTVDADLSDADAYVADATTGLSLAGDADGDGTGDLVVADDSHGSGNGAVFVLPGTARGEVDPSTDATYRYEGAASDSLGYSTTDLGDTTGDGIAELALGARGARDGAVYVVEGGMSAGVYDASAVALATATGERDSYFGFLVASSDHDGDGKGDLIVTAPNAGGGGLESGAVYAFTAPFGAALAVTDAHARWESTTENGDLGRALAADGDVDGDKLHDVLMGDPQAGGDTTRGVAYLQLGPASGVVDVATLLSLNAGTDEAVGTALAFVPDWDGDDKDEVLVGAPLAANDPSTSARNGRAYVVLSGSLAF